MVGHSLGGPVAHGICALATSPSAGNERLGYATASCPPRKAARARAVIPNARLMPL